MGSKDTECYLVVAGQTLNDYFIEAAGSIFFNTLWRKFTHESTLLSFFHYLCEGVAKSKIEFEIKTNYMPITCI